MSYKKHSPIDPEGEPLIRAYILNELEQLTPKERLALVDRIVRLARRELDRPEQTPETHERRQALAQLAEAIMLDLAYKGDYWGQLV
jgi:hypothetical protein